MNYVASSPSIIEYMNPDNLNHRFGLKTVQLCIEDMKTSWKIKSEHRSGNYLTDINDILEID